MIDEKPYHPPKPSVGDHTHTIAKAVLGSVPVLGAAATELFNAIITPPLERRRQEWMETVAERLVELDRSGALSLEGLKSNDAFVTTMMQASQAAVRNHQQEKIDALRNAVLNSALPNPPDESLQQVFLNLVDSFTVWHLRILHLFRNPPRWFADRSRTPPDVMAGGLSMVLESAYPELVGKREFYDQLVRDLNSRGVLGVSGLHTTMTGRGLLERRVTDMGEQFLSFITEPK